MDENAGAARPISKAGEAGRLRPDAQKLLLDLEYIADQLSDFYEPADVRLWLFSRQKLLKGDIPANLIQQGRADDVISVIDQLRDGVFI